MCPGGGGGSCGGERGGLCSLKQSMVVIKNDLPIVHCINFFTHHTLTETHENTHTLLKLIKKSLSCKFETPVYEVYLKVKMFSVINKMMKLKYMYFHLIQCQP